MSGSQVQQPKQTQIGNILSLNSWIETEIQYKL